MSSLKRENRTLLNNGAFSSQVVNHAESNDGFPYKRFSCSIPVREDIFFKISRMHRPIDVRRKTAFLNRIIIYIITF